MRASSSIATSSHCRITIWRCSTNSKGISSRPRSTTASRFGYSARRCGNTPATRPPCGTLAATLGNLAGLRGPADAAEAEALFDESVELQRALAAAAPQDRSRAADLALTHSNRGSLRSRQGRLSEAVESFRAAIVILQRLHDDGPGDKDAARDLAVSLNNLGMALHRLDNLSESERSFRAAAAALPMDTEDDPRRPADCSSRGGIYNNLGLVLQRQQRPVEALEAFDQAIAWQEAACRAAPRVERFRQLLSQHRENREKLDNSPDVEEPTKVD